MGLVGLMNTLKLEGDKYNIKVNTVAPLATTRLTQDVLPPDFLDQPQAGICRADCPVSLLGAMSGHGRHL